MYNLDIKLHNYTKHVNMLLLEIVSTVDLKTFIILETHIHAQGRENIYDSNIRHTTNSI